MKQHVTTVVRGFFLAQAFYAVVCFGLAVGACGAQQRQDVKQVLSWTQTLCLMQNPRKQATELATLCAIDSVAIEFIDQFLSTYRTRVTGERAEAWDLAMHASMSASASGSSAPPAPPAPPPRTLTITNDTAAEVLVSVAFGSDSVVLPSSWPTSTAASAGIPATAKAP